MTPDELIQLVDSLPIAKQLEAITKSAQDAEHALMFWRLLSTRLLAARNAGVLTTDQDQQLTEALRQVCTIVVEIKKQWAL